jgi:hypothetical protein
MDGRTFIDNLEDIPLRDDIKSMSLKSQKNLENWIDTLTNSIFPKECIDTPMLKFKDVNDGDGFKIEYINPRTQEKQEILDRERGIFSYTEYLTENQNNKPIFAQ